MPIITVKLATAVRRSFRVEQVAGMFDVPLDGSRPGRACHPKVKHELTAEVPGLEEEWTIGAIVGPSGSGKTTLAKAAFGDAIYKHRTWPKDRAIIDCFGDMPVKLLTQVLAAVGLGSPVAWLKPYRVLSTGEKFRAELFRAFLTRKPVVVFDEFSGALDRTVAKTASAAFSHILRAQSDPERRLRFVAVMCHRDILPWLSPDWTVELGRNHLCFAKQNTATQAKQRRSAHAAGARATEASNTLACASGLCARLVRGRPGKPAFKFHVERVPQAMWWLFEPHHYLGGGLAASATCYAAFWGGSRATRSLADASGWYGRQECLPHGEPIAFCAVVAALGWPGVKRIQRLVTLPEFQGMGIGGKLLDVVAATQARADQRVTITASHPAVIAHCSRSKQWRYFGIKKTGSTRQEFEGREVASSVGRAVAAFEFVGSRRSN